MTQLQIQDKRPEAEYKGPRSVDDFIKKMREDGKLQGEVTDEMKKSLEKLLGQEFRQLREAENELSGNLESLTRRLEGLQREAAELLLQAPSKISVSQYNTARFSVPNGHGAFRTEEAHVGMDQNSGELVVWSKTNRVANGQPVFEWRKAEEVGGTQLTALYVYQGKVYDRSGEEVKMLQNAGLSSQVSARWMADNMQLEEGKFSTIDNGRMIHIATHKGKTALFTAGPPPAFRGAQAQDNTPTADSAGQQSNQAETERSTAPAHEKIIYHSKHGHCYFQREAHVRLSDGNDGMSKGTLQVWNGNSWEQGSSSRYPERRMACLYVVDGQAYDERGKRVHGLKDDGHQRSVSDVLQNMNVTEGRVSAVPGGTLNNVTHNGMPVVFTKGPPPGFAMGFAHSQVGTDVAARKTLLPAAQVKRMDMTFDPEMGSVTGQDGKPIAGFEVIRDGSGKVTSAVWSANGRPQMRIENQGGQWVVQRRVHEQYQNGYGQVTSTYSDWVGDPTVNLKAPSKSR